jgi:hypothetical protein
MLHEYFFMQNAILKSHMDVHLMNFKTQGCRKENKNMKTIWLHDKKFHGSQF